MGGVNEDASLIKENQTTSRYVWMLNKKRVKVPIPVDRAGKLIEKGYSYCDFEDDDRMIPRIIEEKPTAKSYPEIVTPTDKLAQAMAVFLEASNRNAESTQAMLNELLIKGERELAKNSKKDSKES